MIDCLSGEDEFGCDLDVCPKKCSCLNYAISCTTYGNLSLTDAVTYLKVFIQNAVYLNLSKESFTFTQVLIITETSLADMCGYILNGMIEARQLEISHSFVKSISGGCFKNLIHLKYLNVSWNVISTFSCRSFHAKSNSYSRNVSVFDISHNTLGSLRLCTFTQVKNLVALYIQGNPILHISLDLFNGHKNLSIIFTDNFPICCAATYQELHLNCNATPQWPSSCGDLLSMPAMKVFNILLSLCILTLNLLSIFSCIFSILLDDKRSYMILVLGINSIDMLYGIYMMVIAIVDLHYSGTYFISYMKWQSSIVCHIMAALSLFSLMSSCSLLNILTFSRLMVVIYPFDSRFKRTKLPLYCLMGNVVLCIFLAGISLMSYVLTVGNLQPSSLCTLIGNPNNSTALFIITLAMSLLQITAVCGVITMYVLLYKYATLSTPEVQASSKQKQSTKILQKVILAGTINVLTWVPSSIIYLTSLVLDRYPTSMITWSIILLNPLNNLANPLLLNSIHNVCKACKSGSLSRTQSSKIS